LPVKMKFAGEKLLHKTRIWTLRAQRPYKQNSSPSL